MINLTRILYSLMVKFILGAVDLSRLLLQRVVGYLYKEERLSCGYST